MMGAFYYPEEVNVDEIEKKKKEREERIQKNKEWRDR